MEGMSQHETFPGTVSVLASLAPDFFYVIEE